MNRVVTDRTEVVLVVEQLVVGVGSIERDFVLPARADGSGCPGAAVVVRPRLLLVLVGLHAGPGFDLCDTSVDLRTHFLALVEHIVRLPVTHQKKFTVDGRPRKRACVRSCRCERWETVLGVRQPP